MTLLPALELRAVGAGRTWCRVDPDVLLEGTFVRVNVAVPDEHVHLVNGPTSLRFAVPAGVDRQFVWADAGFNDLGYDVVFVDGYLPDKQVEKFLVSLRIRVPIVDETRVPIWGEAVPDNGTTVELQGNNARAGIELNFTVFGSL